MNLTGMQRRQLQEALLAAFPNEGALQSLVDTYLDENLNAIAGGARLQDTVFNLITWAVARGKDEKLIQAALTENPGSPKLRAFAQEVGLAVPTPASPATQQGGATQSAPAAAPTTTTDVGIIFALAEEFREMHTEIASRATPESDAATGSFFYRFDHPAGNSPYHCVVTFVGDMGMTRASLVTQRLIQQWQPRTLVMVGIAGGISADVHVGDVVVATQVDAYIENAKAVATADGAGHEFDLSGEVYRASGDLINFSRNFPFARPDLYTAWQQECARQLHELIPAPALTTLLKRGRLLDQAQVVDGHIASGPIVGGTAAFSRWLRERDRKYLALEMEAAGLMAAVHEEATQRRTLVLRGISDYGDERKKDLDKVGQGALRRYAVRNAIHLLWAFLDAQALPR